MFDGLYIAQNKALCEEHMGKYPVIFLSLKSVEGLKYEDAIYRITELIGMEAERFGFWKIVNICQKMKKALQGDYCIEGWNECNG